MNKDSGKQTKNTEGHKDKYVPDGTPNGNLPRNYGWF